MDTIDATLQINNETARAHPETDTLFERVQRMAKIGAWSYDILEDTLVWSNEVFRIFEIDPEHFDASFDAFMARVHPEDRTLVNQAYAASLETGEPYGVEHRLLMPDGRVKFVREECETVLGREGKASAPSVPSRTSPH